MEHSRAEYHRHEEEQGDSGIQDAIDDAEQLRFADGANECKGISYEIELPNLVNNSVMNFPFELPLHTLDANGKILLIVPIMAWKAI